MSKSVEERALKIHRSAPVVIGHDHYCDAEHLLGMRSAGLTAKVTHVSVDADLWATPERRKQSLHEYTGWTKPALIGIEQITRLAEAYPDALCIARSAADILAAHKAGRSAVIFGFEGGKPIERDLDLLHVFHRLGLRVMQLMWAGGNDICDRLDPPVCEGLTDFGRKVIHEANDLGILIDLGHCSRKTFDQVIELTRGPVACLHATPRGTKPGAGDLDDDQIKALAATGGLIGMHFFSHYLNPLSKATIDDLIDHVDYVAELVGIDYVALGADYFEITDDYAKGHGMPPGGFLGIPEDFGAYDKLINVTRALCARGYSGQDVRRVIGGNLLRVFESVWGE